MANGHGGRRIGAGRPPGSTSEGRVLRTEARAMLAEIVGTERDPLMVAIEIAADPQQPVGVRLEAALGSARYLHPTLSAAAVQHIPAKADPSQLLAALSERLAKLAPPTIEAAPDLMPTEAAE